MDESADVLGQSAGAAASTEAVRVPLFVDLDGTLVRTDLLVESFLNQVRRNPLIAIKCLPWLLRGRAYLKERLARGHSIAVQTLPYNEPLLAHIGEQVANGRAVFLATASHRLLADAVASHVGLFAGVIATEGSVNMKGQPKLEAIRKMVSNGPFDYAGNEREDLSIWAEARRAVLVGAAPDVAARAASHGNVEMTFPPRRWRRSLLTAMRPHQWLKNTLILVPLLPSVLFVQLTPWVHAGIGLLAFCALASSAYIVNDLLDLDADRAHPRNRHRPFAAGAVPLVVGIVTAAVLALLGFGLALVLPRPFVIVAAIYFALTIAYSLWLKAYALADVVTLAGLYTLRVIAGIAAIGVTASFWLLAFSIFVFFSLAMVKRCTELSMRELRGEQTVGGRGYRVADLNILQTLGVASACVAVLVLALYIHSPEVEAKLRTPELLWPLCPIMLYWLGLVWLKTARGEMHDDPIIFAARDRGSIAAAVVTVALFAAAALLNLRGSL